MDVHFIWLIAVASGISLRIILFQRLDGVHHDMLSHAQHFDLHLLHLLHLSRLADVWLSTGGRGKLIYAAGLKADSGILAAWASAGAGGEDGILASGEGGVGDSEDEFVARLRRMR